MSVPSDEKRDPMLHLAVVEKNGLLPCRSEQIARLKTQTERRSGHLREENVALAEPLHVPREDLLRRDATVGFPGVFAHQMAGEDFVSQRFESVQDFLCGFHGGTVSCHRKTEIDFHAGMHLSPAKYAGIETAGSTTPKADPGGRYNSSYRRGLFVADGSGRTLQVQRVHL